MIRDLTKKRLDELEESFRAHEAVDNDFFRRAKREPWRREDVERFIPEYSAWVREFPQMLAALIGRTRDENLLSHLSSILASELGYGQPAVAHHRLLQSALERCGINLAGLPSSTSRAETQRLLKGLVRIYSGPDADAALGAQYALEVQADVMLKNLWQGFRHLLKEDTSVPYFAVHERDEPDHARSMRRAVEARIEVGGDVRRIEKGASECLDLIAGLWRGCDVLQREAPRERTQ